MPPGSPASAGRHRPLDPGAQGQQPGAGVIPAFAADVIEALIALLNNEIYPCVPAKGSVGASGDLGAARPCRGRSDRRRESPRRRAKIVDGHTGLRRLGMAPLKLEAKEGLALLNGTQVSAALLTQGLFAAEKVFAAALVAGAMSVDAALGSDGPFDDRLHALAGHPGQRAVADILRALLRDSEIRASHLRLRPRQDPYSLRCQPQVMGACLDQLRHAAAVLVRDGQCRIRQSAGLRGNRRDRLRRQLPCGVRRAKRRRRGACLVEIGALSERRVALLTDPNMSELPAFLIAEPGPQFRLHERPGHGRRVGQRDKSLAHPSSIDSLPTSANQEDHVSMSAYAARRLTDMAENAAAIVAIELLAAAQGIDLRRPKSTSPSLQRAHAEIRRQAPFLDEDRVLSADIAAVQALVSQGPVPRHGAVPARSERIGCHRAAQPVLPCAAALAPTVIILWYTMAAFAWERRVDDKIKQWLEDLGLGQYANAFVENDVDLRALAYLTDDDLKELGGLSRSPTRLVGGDRFPKPGRMRATV